MISGVYTHTNHIQSGSLARNDTYLKASMSCETIHRCNRMSRLLKDMARNGPIKLQDVMEATKDHANFPDSVCRHPLPGVPPEGQVKSLGALVMEQGKSGFWITDGNPCENKFYHVG